MSPKPLLFLSLFCLCLCLCLCRRPISQTPLTPTTKNIKWQPQWLTYLQNDTLLKVCPDQNVMKAKYECFVYNVAQVQEAVDNDIQKLQGLYVPSSCVRSKMEKFVPKENMPMPDTGFVFVYYQCEVKKK